MLSTLQSNIEQVLRRLRDAAPGGNIIVLDLYNPYSGTQDVRELIADLSVGQVNGVVAAAAADPELRSKRRRSFSSSRGAATSGSPQTASTPTTTDIS